MLAASAAGMCRAQAQHGEVTLADTLAKAGKASSELASLRAENMELMQVGTHTHTPLHPNDNSMLECHETPPSHDTTTAIIDPLNAWISAFTVQCSDQSDSFPLDFGLVGLCLC
jgi:hypothetical protein